MQVLVRTRPESAHLYAASTCAATLSVFHSVASDAQLLETLTALLTALARAPGCLPLMAQAGLPTLVATLQTCVRRDVPVSHSILLEGTLDLLCSFVSESDPGVPPPLQRHGSAPLPLCTQSDSVLVVVMVDTVTGSGELDLEDVRFSGTQLHAPRMCLSVLQRWQSKSTVRVRIQHASCYCTAGKRTLSRVHASSSGSSC